MCGKLVSPLLRQSTSVSEVQVHGEHVCAVNVCKPASSTSSTGRVTDQPYPAGDTGGQRHITQLTNCSCIHYGENSPRYRKTNRLTDCRKLNTIRRYNTYTDMPLQLWSAWCWNQKYTRPIDQTEQVWTTTDTMVTDNNDDKEHQIHGYTDCPSDYSLS